MSNMLAESTRSAACPIWCILDHSTESEPVTLHQGELETFGDCTVAFGDGPAAPATLAIAQRTLPNGRTEEGMMMNGRFLNEAAVRALHGGLRSAREAGQ